MLNPGPQGSQDTKEALARAAAAAAANVFGNSAGGASVGSSFVPGSGGGPAIAESSFLVDSVALRQTGSAIGCRRTACVSDRVPVEESLSSVPWGSVVRGSLVTDDAGEEWLRVQSDRFVPVRLSGQVLVTPAEAGPGPQLRMAPQAGSGQCPPGMPWAAPVPEQMASPMMAPPPMPSPPPLPSPAGMAMPEIAYLVENPVLRASGSAIGYRRSASLADRLTPSEPNNAAAWGTIIRGSIVKDAAGEDWLRVTPDRFLPFSLNGQVLLTVAQDTQVPQEAPPQSAQVQADSQWLEAAPPEAPKHEVMEWDPASGEMRATTVEVDLDLIPEELREAARRSLRKETPINAAPEMAPPMMCPPPPSTPAEMVPRTFPPISAAAESAFLVDNAELRKSGSAIGYRLSPSLSHRCSASEANSVCAWGSIVCGSLVRDEAGEEWLRVAPDRFLPLRLSGQVLVVPASDAQGQAAAHAGGQDARAPVTPNQGMAPPMPPPMMPPPPSMGIPETAFLVDNPVLRQTGSAIGYRLSAVLTDRCAPSEPNSAAGWGSIVRGSLIKDGAGDEWLQVAFNRFLPVRLNGQVLVTVAQDTQVPQGAGLQDDAQVARSSRRGGWDVTAATPAASAQGNAAVDLPTGSVVDKPKPEAAVETPKLDADKPDADKPASEKPKSRSRSRRRKSRSRSRKSRPRSKKRSRSRRRSRSNRRRSRSKRRSPPRRNRSPPRRSPPRRGNDRSPRRRGGSPRRRDGSPPKRGASKSPKRGGSKSPKRGGSQSPPKKLGLPTQEDMFSKRPSKGDGKGDRKGDRRDDRRDDRKDDRKDDRRDDRRDDRNNDRDKKGGGDDRDSKGKGKGCFNCGGPHFMRDCPESKEDRERREQGLPPKEAPKSEASGQDSEAKEEPKAPIISKPPPMTPMNLQNLVAKTAQPPQAALQQAALQQAALQQVAMQQAMQQAAGAGAPQAAALQQVALMQQAMQQAAMQQAMQQAAQAGGAGAPQAAALQQAALMQQAMQQAAMQQAMQQAAQTGGAGAPQAAAAMQQMQQMALQMQLAAAGSARPPSMPPPMIPPIIPIPSAAAGAAPAGGGNAIMQGLGMANGQLGAGLGGPRPPTPGLANGQLLGMGQSLPPAGQSLPPAGMSLSPAARLQAQLTQSPLAGQAAQAQLTQMSPAARLQAQLNLRGAPGAGAGLASRVPGMPQLEPPGLAGLMPAAPEPSAPSSSLADDKAFDECARMLEMLKSKPDLPPPPPGMPPATTPASALPLPPPPAEQVPPEEDTIATFNIAGFSSSGLNSEYRVDNTRMVNDRPTYWTTDGEHFMYYQAAEKWAICPHYEHADGDVIDLYMSAIDGAGDGKGLAVQDNENVWTEFVDDFWDVVELQIDVTMTSGTTFPLGAMGNVAQAELKLEQDHPEQESKLVRLRRLQLEAKLATRRDPHASPGAVVLHNQEESLAPRINMINQMGPEEQPLSATVWVGHFPKSVETEEVLKFFDGCGEVANHQHERKAWADCLVQFRHKRSAALAVQRDGKILSGVKVKVEYSQKTIADDSHRGASSSSSWNDWQNGGWKSENDSWQGWNSSGSSSGSGGKGKGPANWNDVSPNGSTTLPWVGNLPQAATKAAGPPAPGGLAPLSLGPHGRPGPTGLGSLAPPGALAPPTLGAVPPEPSQDPVAMMRVAMMNAAVAGNAQSPPKLTTPASSSTGSPEPPALQRALPTGAAFRVTIDRTDSGQLGIEPDFSDGRTLLIKRIIPGGLMAGWNSSKPQFEVQIGDRISAVNAASGTADALVTECREPKILQITVIKGDGTAVIPDMRPASLPTPPGFPDMRPAPAPTVIATPLVVPPPSITPGFLPPPPPAAPVAEVAAAAATLGLQVLASADAAASAAAEPQAKAKAKGRGKAKAKGKAKAEEDASFEETAGPAPAAEDEAAATAELERLMAGEEKPKRGRAKGKAKAKAQAASSSAEESAAPDQAIDDSLAPLASDSEGEEDAAGGEEGDMIVAFAAELTAMEKTGKKRGRKAADASSAAAETTAKKGRKKKE